MKNRILRKYKINKDLSKIFKRKKLVLNKKKKLLK